MDFITHMEPWHWMALGIVILAIEVMVSTELLLGIGIGALLTALVYKLYPELSWQMQLVWFAVLSIVATFIYWKKFRASKQVSDQPLLNQRAQQLIGQTSVLVEPIVNGKGKIQVADALWTVQGPELEEGVAVKIVATDGMTLTVEPV
jgi:membrane protein implicated in regulation of membrane protease activity